MAFRECEKTIVRMPFLEDRDFSGVAFTDEEPERLATKRFDTRTKCRVRLDKPITVVGSDTELNRSSLLLA